MVMPLLSGIPVLMSKGPCIFPLNLPRNLWLFLVLITYFCLLLKMSHTYTIYFHILTSPIALPRVTISLSTLCLPWFFNTLFFIFENFIHIYNAIWSCTETIFPLQCPYIPPNRVHLGLPVCLMRWTIYWNMGSLLELHHWRRHTKINVVFLS